MLTHMLVSARGLEFEVFIDGPAEGPVVLLLHGFPQHSGQWEAVLPALHAAGLRTVAINQRGYSPGARPAEPTDYVLSECIADAVSIMDALGIDQFHVVGHDWGAAVGWGLASAHSDRVKSLVAISVPHMTALIAALADEDSDQAKRSEYMRFFADLDRSVPFMLKNGGSRMRNLFMGSGMSDEHMEKYIGPMRDPAVLRGALSWYAALFSGAPTRMGPVSTPTTYLWSNADIALGRDAAVACERFVTGDYRFIELDGVSHWIPDQAPDATAHAIVERVAAHS